jgi:hypothetical protein
MPKKTRGKKQTRYVSRLAVFVPGLNAVIDMMRYECCYPATEVESGKLSADTPGIVRFTMVASSDREPSRERWRSFGCVVLATWGADDVGLTDSELDGLLVFHNAST